MISDREIDRALRRHERIAMVRHGISYIVFAVAVSILFVTFVAQRTVVRGESMTPSFKDGTQVLTSKISYRVHDVKRNDVIVFFPEKDHKVRYIKRVIGLPGETVQIKKGDIYINDKKIDDIIGETPDAGLAEDKIKLGKNEYFVLGDNRNNSQDSRYIGPIEKSSIIGKVVLKLFPLGSVK